VAKKEINFGDDLVLAIQAYADVYCEGNFNLAVRQLTRSGLMSEQNVKQERQSLS